MYQFWGSNTAEKFLLAKTYANFLFLVVQIDNAWVISAIQSFIAVCRTIFEIVVLTAIDILGCKRISLSGPTRVDAGYYIAYNRWAQLLAIYAASCDQISGARNISTFWSHSPNASGFKCKLRCRTQIQKCYLVVSLINSTFLSLFNESSFCKWPYRNQNRKEFESVSLSEFKGFSVSCYQ